MSEKTLATYVCHLTTLSPVHVGCGEKYLKGLDYLIDGKKIQILNKKKLFSLVEKMCSEKDVFELTDSIMDRNIAQWLKEKKINYNEAVARKYSHWKCGSIKEIHAGIKNIWGRPIIPGSSVKGALRTAILSDLNQRDNFRVLGKLLGNILRKRKFLDRELKTIDQELTKKLLGRDPNHNLMRTISVGDFSFPGDTFSLVEVRVNTILKNGQLGEKSFKIYPEVIESGAKGEGKVTIDGFLFEQDSKKDKKIFGFDTKVTLKYLITAVNQRSESMIESEKEFFNSRKNNVVQFYMDLERQMENLGENELITRISWGTGWKSITGEIIPESKMSKKLRSALKLAPNRYPAEFPKTRKLVHEKDGDLPLGWIKLTFLDVDQVREKERIEKEKRLARIRAEEARRAAEEARKREQEERKAYLESLSPEERDIEMVKDPNVTEQRVVEIFNKIDSFSDANKKKLAEALKDYWIEHNKWRGKLSNKQKKKVAKIRKILETA